MKICQLKIALPKGRLFESTLALLEQSGIILNNQLRNYKPESNLAGVQFYVIKPRNIPKLVEQGLFDAGIVGQDLIIDEQAQVELVLNLHTMPVYLVLAGQTDYHAKNKIIVASEYTAIATKYLQQKGLDFSLLKTYGSTEAFVPDFADLIIDHTQTGTTLRQNKLRVFDIIMKSTTYLLAHHNLSTEKRVLLQEFQQQLQRGLANLDLSYPNFLTDAQIKAQFGGEPNVRASN